MWDFIVVPCKEAPLIDAVCDDANMDNMHWKGNVFILTKFSSLAAMEIDKMTTSWTDSGQISTKWHFSFSMVVISSNANYGLFNVQHMHCDKKIKMAYEGDDICDAKQDDAKICDMIRSQIARFMGPSGMASQETPTVAMMPTSVNGGCHNDCLWTSDDKDSIMTNLGF